jgi:exonuclease VII large subunit
MLLENGLRLDGLFKSLPSPLSIVNRNAQKIDEMVFVMEKKLLGKFHDLRHALLGVSAQLKSPVNLLERHVLNISNNIKLLTLGYVTFLSNKSKDLHNISQLLGSLSFEKTLQRGFAIVRSKESNNIVRLGNDLTSGTKIDIQFTDTIKTAHIQ